jgi:hypothetical protein
MITKGLWFFEWFETFKTKCDRYGFDAALLMGVLREIKLGQKLYCYDLMQNIQVDTNSMDISFGYDLH